ncbi:MAG: hypothetical protein ACP5Q3_07750, partial [bacterium]
MKATASNGIMAGDNPNGFISFFILSSAQKVHSKLSGSQRKELSMKSRNKIILLGLFVSLSIVIALGIYYWKTEQSEWKLFAKRKNFIFYYHKHVYKWKEKGDEIKHIWIKAVPRNEKGRNILINDVRKYGIEDDKKSSKVEAEAWRVWLNCSKGSCYLMMYFEAEGKFFYAGT